MADPSADLVSTTCWQCGDQVLVPLAHFETHVNASHADMGQHCTGRWAASLD